MGWEVIVLNIDGRVESVADLENATVRPLGFLDGVVSAIQETFPAANVSDPDWIVITGNEYSLTLSLNIQHELVETLIITVHGSPAAIDDIELLCTRLGWRAFDTAAGDFIDFANPDRERGYETWKDYREETKKKNEL